MSSEERPNLQFLHAAAVLNRVKLEAFRRHSSEEIMATLTPGKPASLKVRADGTVLDGHHSIYVLLERGEDIHALPREILEREDVP